MKLLRLLIPLLSCYVADVLIFDGQYFGALAPRLTAPSGTAQLPGGVLVPGAWRIADPLRQAEISPCRLEAHRLVCR